MDSWLYIGDLKVNLEQHLTRQYGWSIRTFGPGPRTKGVLKHIKKEIVEIEDRPDDLEEWIDLIILGFDGALRQGYHPSEVVECLAKKQLKNEMRRWPDWREFTEDEPIEHIKNERVTSN